MHNYNVNEMSETPIVLSVYVQDKSRNSGWLLSCRTHHGVVAGEFCRHQKLKDQKPETPDFLWFMKMYFSLAISDEMI